MEPPKVKGFRYMGWSGSSGSSLSGSQRVARMRGEPEPTQVQGKKSQGRASTVRTYTVKAQRLSDGKEMSETIGPAYWSKKRWEKERAACFLRLVKKLGG